MQQPWSCFALISASQHNQDCLVLRCRCWFAHTTKRHFPCRSWWMESNMQSSVFSSHNDCQPSEEGTVEIRFTWRGIRFPVVQRPHPQPRLTQCLGDIWESRIGLCFQQVKQATVLSPLPNASKSRKEIRSQRNWPEKGLLWAGEDCSHRTHGSFEVTGTLERVRRPIRRRQLCSSRRRRLPLGRNWLEKRRNGRHNKHQSTQQTSYWRWLLATVWDITYN